MDANLLRWVKCCAILLTVALLATGARYTGRLPWPGSAGVGGLSGIMTGALGMGGPPVVLLWLGGQDEAAQTRANIITCFALTAIVATASFVLAGLMTWPRILAGMGLAVAYGLALLVGIRVFSRSTERHYRRAALAVCAAAALIGLPPWQRA